MKIILFGATGMVGQGALRECLLDPEVEKVVTVGRSATGRTHPKLHELVHKDLLDYSALDAELHGFDACLFCLGISSAGMSEADYTRTTHDIALAAARALVERNPAMTFVFVSGAGTDSTETSRTMWARVKGKAENAILALPFKAAYMFRPAVIQPQHGITSKTTSYRVMYAVMRPLFPLLKAVAPKHVTTSESVGRAMLAVVKHGFDKRILENDDINRAARSVAAVSPEK